MNKKSDCKFVLMIGLSLILGSISQSCGSSRSVSYNEQVVATIEEAINSFVFSFKATKAFPLQDRPQNVAPNHYVKVSPNSIAINLPYYGRVIGGSMSGSDFNFISRAFEHNAGLNKDGDSWLIKINIKDQNRPITLDFKIRKDGNTRLTIEDANRQKISYEGDFEAK